MLHSKYGIRIDLARYDLEELGRQGRWVPDGMTDRIDAAARHLRLGWMELDREREELHTAVLSLPPKGDAVPRIDDLGRSTGAGAWIGLK